MPPLAVKIAARIKGRRLSEEADVYDQLSSLQGTIIPLCFGYFRRFVNLQEMSLAPWDPNCTFPRSFDIYHMPHTDASLNMLLMERMGTSLRKTPRHILPDNLSELRDQLIQMYKAAGELGFNHKDIKSANILRVLEPSATTAASESGYLWRLVDWEDCHKMEMPLQRQVIFSEIKTEVKWMIENDLRDDGDGDGSDTGMGGSDDSGCGKDEA
ncbi:uncharacterized protein TRAVEDRAFT_49168 [Trametes versicolor FP-101664 SS1]|uniref:uncharacterized protein n=1 Tax=Trametes versicolor (strain FP-101664) TaxID=717944 RepID=UPI0004622D58|nr:uncharacterized protein TRAVEDRAFT_49168 [Trametes versicolor FP-101664 SS1]EIW56339.1 hypothetical protein TRAVEDRAFT_49168 [Trametes versicolor FP-101664 SS1]